MHNDHPKGRYVYCYLIKTGEISATFLFAGLAIFTRDIYIACLPDNVLQFRHSHDHKKPYEFNEFTYYRAGEFCAAERGVSKTARENDYQ